LKYFGLTADRHATQDKVGVLLVNLGTPAAPETGAVRRYLRQFLSDPRVIELPRLLWFLLLNCVILPIRSPRSAKMYRSVWTKDGSPLMQHSMALAKNISDKLSLQSPNYLLEMAMSYGEPAIPTALEKLAKAGARRLVVLPLYPQYSGSTTGSVFDGFSSALQKHRWVGDVRFISQYFERPDYIAALADSVRAHWQKNGRSDKLMLSFHGIPKRYFDNGDLYHCHCYGTARRLREALDLHAEEVIVSFQSRVGREEWLRPYTDHVIEQLGKSGTQTLDVLCPGFAVDCLETLEEIAVENAEHFVKSGGKALNYIPALNASDPHAQLLANLIVQHAGGWPEIVVGYNVAGVAKERMDKAEALRK
jgi:protoporphyrin/coproporphyrin ferrochelatase